MGTVHQALKLRIYPNQAQERVILKSMGCARFVFNKLLEERIQVYEKLKDDRAALYHYQYKIETDLKKEYLWLKEVSKFALQSARFAYNWALAEWGKQYQAWKLDNTQPRPSQMSLRLALNALKREQFPWMMEVSKCAPEEAIMQLGTAFQNFFAGRARYPKFRKKGLHDRFSLSNSQLSMNATHIRIPRLGWVRMWLRFAGKIMSATVSRVADKWDASITVDVLDYTPRTKAENQGAVGVDLGVSALATLSTGEKIPGPKGLKASLRKLKRLSRGLSRKVLEPQG